MTNSIESNLDDQYRCSVEIPAVQNLLDTLNKSVNYL